MRIVAITRDLGADERRQRVVQHLKTIYDVVCIQPKLSLLARTANLALSVSVRKDAWRERSKKNAFFFASMSRSIRRAVLRHPRQPDDVILTFEALFSPGFGSSLLKPFVMYEDGTSKMTMKRWPPWVPATARSKRYCQLEEATYGQAAHVFTTSNWVRESLLQDYGLPAQQVTDVGQGQDFDPPKDMCPCIGPILFVGYEWERKGGPVLLQAFQQLRIRHPDARLAIVGPNLRVAIPGVTVHGHITDKSQLLALYRNASIFVLPSIFDPNPHAAMEAMSMGVPVVVSEGCGTQEILEIGKSGFIVPIGSAPALTDVLDRLIGDLPFRIQVGQAGAQRLQETSSWAHAAHRIAKVINRIFPAS